MEIDSKILIANKKAISCYDENRLIIDWRLDLGKRIYRIGKHHDTVLAQTYSAWGVSYLNGIALASGKLLWSFKTTLMSTLIVHEGVIYFVDYQNKINAISQADGQLLFKVRFKSLWRHSKLALIHDKLYLYAGKKHALVHPKTGALSYGRSPQGMEFQGAAVIYDSHQLILSAGRTNTASTHVEQEYIG